MTDRSLFARMMSGVASVGAANAGTTSTAVAPTTPATPAPAASTEQPAGEGLTEAQVEPMLQAAKAEGVTEGTQAGADAERARTAAVFGSTEGQANMPMAAWMLESSPNASADSIIAKLATMPKATTVASTTEPAAPVGKVTTPLAETPKADLGNASQSTDGSSTDTSANKDKDPWAGTLTDMTKAGAFGSQMRFTGELAKHAPAAGSRTGH